MYNKCDSITDVFTKFYPFLFVGTEGLCSYVNTILPRLKRKRRTETSSTMCKIALVVLLSGGKASADASIALSRATATLPVVFDTFFNPFDDSGITIEVEKSTQFDHWEWRTSAVGSRVTMAGGT